MKSKTIIVLSVLLIVCVVYVVVTHRGRPVGTAEQQKGQGFVFARRIDGLVDLAIEDSDGHRIMLRRVDGLWRIASPVQARADAFVAGEIVSALGELRFSRTVSNDEQGADDAQLGFTHPAWRIVATCDDGERFELLVGAQAPAIGTRRETYVRPVPARSDGISAYVVGLDFDRLLDHPVNDFRDKRVVEFSAGQIVRIRVEGEHRYTLQRGDDGWEIVLSPKLTAPANPEAVRRLAERIAALQANDFVDVGADGLARRGLTESEARLTLKVAYHNQADLSAGQAPAEEVTLLLGHQSQQDIYARLAGDETVFLLDQAMLDELQPDPDSLRSRQVVTVAPAAVGRVSIASGGSNVELVRKDGQWRMLAPLDGPADRESVERLLAGISDMQASGFHDDTPAAVLGLAKPRVTITLHLSPPGGQVKVAVGFHAPGGEEVFVRSDHLPTAVTVSSSAASLLLNSPGHYYTRNIGTIPPDAKITRLVLNRPDGTFTVLMDDEGHWQMLAPTTGRADNDVVRRVIDRIRNLQAQEIVSWAPDLPDIYRGGPNTTIVAALTVAPVGPARPTQTYVLRMVRLYDEQSGLVVGTYAWAPGTKPPVVGKVGSDVFEELMVNLSWRRLWQLDPQTVRQIQIAQGADEPFVIDRNEGRWAIADDPYARVNVAAIADYLEAIKQLSVQEYLSDTVGHLDRFGLEVPWLTVQLTRQDGTIHRIVVADHGPGETTTTRYASASGVDVVFLISADAIGKLARHPAEFRAD